MQREIDMLRRVLTTLWFSLNDTQHQHVMLGRHLCISDLVVPHLEKS